MYAVIAIKWHQYIVAEWDSIVVDFLNKKEGEKIEVENVVSVFDEKWEKMSLGAPYLKNASVSCEVGESKRGDKIKVTKFRRKNRYQRTIGFRPKQTVLHIKKITV